MDAKPLADEAPSEATLDFRKGTKRWPVWASKVLHFLRPDAFPILDSNAKKPLGLKNLVNSSRGYHQFSPCFRDVWRTLKPSWQHVSRTLRNRQRI
jgi:hypothetical protein